MIDTASRNSPAIIMCKVIRQERYSGAMQRSFYVGEGIQEEDIKAKFEHGVLNLIVPKKDVHKIPEKKTIMIEG